MKSFTTLQNLASNITGVASTDTTNLALLAQYLNDSIRTICTIRSGAWPWLETLPTATTVASQEYVYVPNKVRKIVDVYVTVGSTTYMPEVIYDAAKWKLVIAANLGTGDVPLFVYKQGEKLMIAPTPASTGNTVTMRGRLNVRDLSIADYTTGSIVSIANGATAIIGTGTTFTADMVGRFIRITETTAANGGDGSWYEIGSYTSATSIGLLKPYEGTSIAAGTAAYTIGQMSPIPEAYDVAPVYRAVALYWSQKENFVLANSYWRMYDGGQEAGLLSHSSPIGGIIGQMLEEAADTFEGSYIPPFGSRMNFNQAPYYFPYNDASGF